jgi:hypothetical protein
MSRAACLCTCEAIRRTMLAVNEIKEMNDLSKVWSKLFGSEAFAKQLLQPAFITTHRSFVAEPLWKRYTIVLPMSTDGGGRS